MRLEWLKKPITARPPNVAKWWDVDAVPDKPDWSDRIEQVGRRFGLALPVREADETIRIMAHHGEFAKGMRLSGVLDLIERTEERFDTDGDTGVLQNIGRPVSVIPIPVPRPHRDRKPPIPRPSPFPPN